MFNERRRLVVDQKECVKWGRGGRKNFSFSPIVMLITSQSVVLLDLFTNVLNSITRLSEEVSRQRESAQVQSVIRDYVGAI